jgi:hypothetical protein
MAEISLIGNDPLNVDSSRPVSANSSRHPGTHVEWDNRSFD